jgi:hypothetical protein
VNSINDAASGTKTFIYAYLVHVTLQIALH